MTQVLRPGGDSKPPEHEIAADSEAETEKVRCLVEAPDLVELVQSPEAVAAGAGPVAGLEAAAAGAALGEDPEAAEVGAGLEAAAAAAGLEAGPGDDLEAGHEAAEVGAEADLEAAAEGAGLVEVDLVVPAEVFGGHLDRGPDHLHHLVHLPGPSLANVCHVHPFEAILETKTKKRIF